MSFKMVIEALDDKVVAQIRSSSTIDSVTQCVNELVLNSLDAKSTAVAVRVNLSTFRIQVVDNGKGISRSNLELVGQRYMTNKCHSLEDLKKNLKYYGFKGEALASISNISQRVTITTREQNCEETYTKTIENNESRIESTKTRPSFGTTATVEGFLNNLPVRQQCVKTNVLETVKRSLESLIIIHPRVSFTLRNDLGGKLLLSSIKCQDIANSFKTIHPEIDENEFVLLRVSKNKTSVEGLIHKNFHENKRLQYIYLNKRPITCPKVQNLINSNLTPKSEKKSPIFIIHIKCPYSDVDINLEPTKTVAFFRKFDIVKRCIEKMMNTFLGGGNTQVATHKSRNKNIASEFGVSQLVGAVRGFGVKRKSDEIEEVMSNKSAKIIEETPLFEEPKVPSLPLKKNEVSNDIINKSVFTNFPENEERGKDVIMDMFIMSLKAFPPENKESEGKSIAGSPPQDTTFVPEEDGNKVAKGVQTSFNEGNVVSVGVQVDNIDFHIDSEFGFVQRKPLTKFVSDYNFDFSKIDTFPAFNFNRKCPLDTPFFDNCDQTRKLFDFRDKCQPGFEVFGNADPHRASAVNFLQNPPLSPVISSPPKKKVYSRLQTNPTQRSPYFSKKPKSRNILPQKHEQHKRNILIDTFSYCDKNSRLNQVEMSFCKKDKTTKILNESSVSKYFTSKKNRKFKMAASGDSEDLFHCTGASQMSQNFGDEDKENRLLEDRNVSFEKRLTEDIIGPTLTLPPDRNDWIKEVNNFGTTVYTNKKTGLKTLTDPKKDFTFEVTERFDFVPKGLSPILKDYGKVEDMSPQSRDKLQDALIQSYEDELLLIKWKNCIGNRDPKKFFEDIYLAKSKLIEGSIPNISKKSKHGIKGFENMSFTMSLFNNLDIIGQVDCKFIAVLDKTRKLILLFDQHAVHERVRLEELSKGYKNTSTKLDQKITIFLPHGDLRLLKRLKVNLITLGLTIDFFTNGITISEVPLCIYNKSKKGVDIVSLTETLIKEVVETSKTNNGILVNTPLVIQNIVNSEACRGAIKFGDSLSKNECIAHLKKLSECNLPFQCAHGRPTLTPLLSLSNSFHDMVIAKPKLNKLRC